MSERYRHTQVGRLVLVLIVPAVMFLLFIIVSRPVPVLVWPAIALLLFALASMSSLTVTVDTREIVLQFGFGPIRKRFALRDIEAVRAVDTPIWYGWGIRLIPSGWLYRVSGSHSVELRMKNGRVYRIGTDEPEELARTIARALAEVDR